MSGAVTPKAVIAHTPSPPHYIRLPPTVSPQSLYIIIGKTVYTLEGFQEFGAFGGGHWSPLPVVYTAHLEEGRAEGQIDRHQLVPHMGVGTT